MQKLKYFKSFFFSTGGCKYAYKELGTISMVLFMFSQSISNITLKCEWINTFDVFHCSIELFSWHFSIEAYQLHVVLNYAPQLF